MRPGESIHRVDVGAWLPDVWVGDDGDLELAVTAPIDIHQVIVVIPAEHATAWAETARTAIAAALDRPGDGPLEDP